jgi:hypothetical protein
MKNKYFDLTVGCHFEIYRDKAPLSSFALLFHKRNADKKKKERRVRNFYDVFLS